MEDRTRRDALKTGVALATTVSLAGCSGDDKEPSGEGNPKGPRGSNRPQRNTTGSLTVGHIAPLASPLGVGSERAAEIAIDQVNNNNGVMDVDVELVSGDTTASSTEAEIVVEELIQQENADVIVGAFQSEVSRAVIDLTSEFNVPFISSGPAAPDLTKGFVGEDYDTYKHYFRVGPINSALQAEAMGDYITYLSDRHGWNSLAFYREQAAWTEVFGRDLPGIIESQGLTIEYQGVVSTEGPDLSPLLSIAEQEDVDFMLLFLHLSLLPQLKSTRSGEETSISDSKEFTCLECIPSTTFWFREPTSTKRPLRREVVESLR